MTSLLDHFGSLLEPRSAPLGIDLFSGAGGLSLGFLLAGGRPVAAVDNDRDSTLTYARNFPTARENVFLGPIEQWEPPEALRGIDVVIGGPPCQGFSLARGTRFVDDPRNRLYKEFVRTVGSLQPAWFVMENVEGILSIAGGAVVRQIEQDFLDVGYHVEYRVINMAQYGVPQTRRRAIFVGSRERTTFNWPVPTNQIKGKGVEASQFVSVNDAIDDLVLPVGHYFSHRANSQMRGPRNRLADRDAAFTLRVRGDEFGLCEEPAVSSFIPGPAPQEPLSARAPRNEYQELMTMPRPTWVRGPTRRVGTRRPTRLKETRRLTITELARLQSFPDWFEFMGVRTSQARQIGNAAPPLFAAHLFRAIFAQL